MSKTLLGMTRATLILACTDLAHAQQPTKIPRIGYLNVPSTFSKRTNGSWNLFYPCKAMRFYGRKSVWQLG
jgi:hypothetical protein